MSPTALIAQFAERHQKLSAAIRKGTVRDVSKVVAQYAGVLKDASGIPTSLAISNPSAAQVSQIDDKAKAIPFIVTVLQEDRDGDVVIPRGIQTNNYVNNPVVFFGHQEWVVPIGKAKSPSGKLAWNVNDTEARSVCYFDSPDPDSMFIYGKVQRGFLSATSIAFVPVEAYKRDDYDKAYRGEKDSMMPVGWLFKKVDLTEWSIVGVPSNAGAIRDSLDSEKSFITPRLQKALVPYAAQPRGRCFSGWCPVPAKAVARTSVQKGATSVTTKSLPFWSDLKKTVAKGDAALLAAIERDGKKLVERANPTYYSFEDRDKAERYKPAVDLARSLYAAARSGDMEEVLRIYRSFPISDGLMNTRLVLIQSGVLKAHKSLTVTKAGRHLGNLTKERAEEFIRLHPECEMREQKNGYGQTLGYGIYGPESALRSLYDFKQGKKSRKSLTVTKEICPNNGRMTLSDDYGCPAAFDSMRKGKASCEGCGKSLDLIPFKLKGKSKMVLQSTTISKLAQRRKGSVFNWMGTIDGKPSGFVVAGDDIRAWVGPNQFKGKVVWNQLKINWEYPLPDTPDRYLLEHEVFTNAKSKAKKAPCSCSGSCGGKGSCSSKSALSIKKDIGLWKWNRRTGYWDLARMCADDTAQQWLARWKQDEPNEYFVLSRNKPNKDPRKSLNSTSGTSGGYLVPEQFEDEDMTTKRKPAKKTTARRVVKGEGSTAYNIGWNDRVKGARRNDNPFSMDRAEEFRDWAQGWIAADKAEQRGEKITQKSIARVRRKDNAEETAQEEATEHGADMDVVETAMEESPEVFAGDETPEEEAAEEAAIEAVKAPHSAYALAMSHQHLKALKDYIAAEDEVFEPDSGVRKYLKEKLEPDLDHHMEKMGEMFGARYPNQEMSKLCGGPSEDKAEIEEEDVVTKGRRLKSVRKNMILSIYVPPEKVNSIRSQIEGSGGKVRINGNEGGLTKLTMEGDDRQIGWAVSEDEGPRRNRPFKPFEDSKDWREGQKSAVRRKGLSVEWRSSDGFKIGRDTDGKYYAEDPNGQRTGGPFTSLEEGQRWMSTGTTMMTRDTDEFIEEKDELDAMDGVVEMEEDEEVEKGEFEEEEIIASDDLNGTEDADRMTEEEADEIVDESTEEILERYAAETTYKGKGRRKMASRRKGNKFNVGDRVTFKNDPEAVGTITSVEYDPKSHDEPVYTVKLGSGSELAEESELKPSRKSAYHLSLKNLSGRWFVKQVTKDGEELHGPYDTVDEATEVKAEMETEEKDGASVAETLLEDGVTKSLGDFVVVTSGRPDPSTKNPDRKAVERLARGRQAKYPNWDIEIARETERGYEIINDFYPHEKDDPDAVEEMDEDDDVEKGFDEEEEKVLDEITPTKSRRSPTKKSTTKSFDDWISRMETLAFRATGVKLN